MIFFGMKDESLCIVLLHEHCWLNYECFEKVKQNRWRFSGELLMALMLLLICQLCVRDFRDQNYVAFCFLFLFSFFRGTIISISFDMVWPIIHLCICHL